MSLVDEQKEHPPAPRARAARNVLESPQVEQVGLHDMEGNLRGGRVLFQWSLHKVTRSLRKECSLIFPELEKGQTLYAIPTFQKTAVALVGWGSVEASEKDCLLENFFTFGHLLRQEIKDLCQKEALSGAESWSDFVDPCSGHAAVGQRGNCMYNEVDAAMKLLRYPTQEVGAANAICHVLLHPEWGSACYPATFLTTAPPVLVREAVVAVLKSMALVGVGQDGAPELSKP